MNKDKEVREDNDQSRLNRRKAIKVAGAAATALVTGAAGAGIATAQPHGKKQLARAKLIMLLQYAMTSQANAEKLVSQNPVVATAAFKEAIGDLPYDPAEITAVMTFKIQQLDAISLAFVGTKAVN